MVHIRFTFRPRRQTVLGVVLLLIIYICPASGQTRYRHDDLHTERWGRGVVAVRTHPDTVAVTWRYLDSDPADVAFHVYRDGIRLTSQPLTHSTHYADYNPDTKSATYEVRPAKRGFRRPASGRWTLPADAPLGYLHIPLVAPPSDVMPDGSRSGHTPNDASAADLDGDGEPEIVLKWEPTNARDNAHNGFTGCTHLEALELTGERLWRINLGRNIRSGAHYTPFVVYDLDGDGRAEVVVKTADGTTDAWGTVIGDSTADHRHGVAFGTPTVEPTKYRPGRVGFISRGPEYLTVFDGRTGRALHTTDYFPPRGEMHRWGDNYGNRSERYLACAAYLDGRRASVVMCRGYYTRTVLAAYDWDGHELRRRWVFDTDTARWARYAGQGNHNLRVGDVDGDGCDEITTGSCCIDHDGTGLYNTHMGHGDALHLTAFSPESDALQVWDCHENRRDGTDFREAATGRVLWQVRSHKDVGRCMAADIDAGNEGLEMWSSASGGIRNVRGEVVNPAPRTLPMNMAVWWDGDLLREMLDRATISKYDAATGTCLPLLRMEGCAFNNGTKSNPCLQADLVGDWREEVLTRTTDNTALRLYVTPHPTPYRFHTFLHDPVYRLSIVSQNAGYNQPTQPGFFFGADLEGSGRTFRGHQFAPR